MTIRERVLALSDKTERTEAKMTKLDDKMWKLRNSIKDEYKHKRCSECDSSLGVARIPVDAPQLVKKTKKEIERLDREYAKLEQQLEGCIDEAQDIVTELFKDTRFDVYGIDFC